MSNTFMYDKVVAVISKPVDLRQDFEIQTLVPWFRKKSSIFSEIKTDFVKDIIRNCRFVNVIRDDIIIKQGDTGECFYIILGGKISIFIFNKDKDGDDDVSELEQICKKGKDGKLDRSKLGNFVTSLESGSPFGEVALVSKDCIRTATVIADEQTDLLVVDRALYNRSVRDVLAKEFEEKTTFIKNNPLFSNWAPKYRKQLAMALYKETYPYESMLVRQGDPVDKMYFIISGQVEVQIDPSLHPNQYSKIFIAANQSEAEKLMRKVDKARPPTESQAGGNIKKRDNFRSMKLCYLGINESLGDIEVLLDLATYMQTAVCKEKTSVLVLEMKHFERLFVKRHQRTIDAIRDQLGVKLETRISLLSNKEEIPLLGYVSKKIMSRNRPVPPSEKDRRETTTVSEAEKEFLNHKGPLIDMYGPGSVFHMIRVREKTKLKLRLKRERQIDRPLPSHVHTVSVPPSLLVAAQMAGAREFEEGRRPQSSRGLLEEPRSFRRIQSAHAEHTMDSFEEYQDDEYGDESEYTDPSSNGVIIDHGAHDAALSNLEERIRQWLKRDNPKGGPQVTQLRRLAVENMDIQPRPGNRVIVRRRKQPISSALMDQPSKEVEEDRLAHLKILLTR